MNAPLALPASLDRLTSWFRRGESEALPAGIDRQSLHRLRYEQIGALLFKHALEPSAVNFDFACRFLDGADAALIRATREVIEQRGGLTDRDVERIVESCAPDTAADKLDLLTRELEGKVAECLAAVSDSAASTTAYSSALDAAADQIASQPAEAYRRLLEVTLEVAETTRKIGGRLERTRHDTRRLRADLDRAVRAAEEDHLTGLPNRRCFIARVEKAIAAGTATPLTIALCDIDNFKSVNDCHGHDTGDRVLRYVARLLREQLHRDVLVARYGGEEFICLFEGFDVDAAATMLDDARHLLSLRLLRDQGTNLPIGTVTFSAGVAAIDGDPTAALRAADEMLYAAKNAGKDQVLIAP